ncbi:MAG: hypothetical protein HYS64_08720 [Rhodospirillales bacterium]|nr:hypothetical protein [Rhodospirillales bacterium]
MAYPKRTDTPKEDDGWPNRNGERNARARVAARYSTISNEKPSVARSVARHTTRSRRSRGSGWQRSRPPRFPPRRRSPSPPRSRPPRRRRRAPADDLDILADDEEDVADDDKPPAALAGKAKSGKKGDDKEDALIEDPSDLGEDEDDMGEVKEHIDDGVGDKV